MKVVVSHKKTRIDWVDVPCWESVVNAFNLSWSLARLGLSEDIHSSVVTENVVWLKRTRKTTGQRVFLVIATSCSKFPSGSWIESLIAIVIYDVIGLGKTRSARPWWWRRCMKKIVALMKQREQPVSTLKLLWREHLDCNHGLKRIFEISCTMRSEGQFPPSDWLSALSGCLSVFLSV